MPNLRFRGNPGRGHTFNLSIRHLCVEEQKPAKPNVRPHAPRGHGPRHLQRPQGPLPHQTPHHRAVARRRHRAQQRQPCQAGACGAGAAARARVGAGGRCHGEPLAVRRAGGTGTRARGRTGGTRGRGRGARAGAGEEGLDLGALHELHGHQTPPRVRHHRHRPAHLLRKVAHDERQVLRMGRGTRVRRVRHADTAAEGPAAGRRGSPPPQRATGDEVLRLQPPPLQSQTCQHCCH